MDLPSLVCLCAGNPKMKKKPLKPEIFYSLFEDFPGFLALLDEKGNILLTNTFWQKEAIRRGMLLRADGVGYNYLDLCKKTTGEEKEFAQRVLEGILAVFKKKINYFSLLYEMTSNEKASTEKFLFLFFPLRTKPKVYALLHQRLPEEKTSLPLYVFEDKPTPSFLASWLSFLNGILYPFLTLLEAKLDPDLNKIRLEILKKLKEFEKLTLFPLNPLAMLTTKEAQIALLVKEGKTSEEIAKILNLGKDAVDFYRKKIREKLGLKGQKISLKEYLQRLFDFSSKKK